MSHDEKWSKLEAAVRDGYASEDYRAWVLGHGLPESLFQKDPAVRARENVGSWREGFERGSRYDVLRHNRFSARFVKELFGFTTTKAWREAWYPKAPAGEYTMVLKSCGNPDFGQYAPVSEPKTLRASSLRELLAAAAAYQEEWNLGGGNWLNPVVRDAEGKVVGYFSYNLRFWEGDGKPSAKARKEILL